MFQANVVEEINTHFMFNNHKHTYTHTHTHTQRECVLLIAFPLQEMLSTFISNLRRTHTVLSVLLILLHIFISNKPRLLSGGA
jgi:hypothetical protein